MTWQRSIWLLSFPFFGRQLRFQFRKMYCKSKILHSYELYSHDFPSITFKINAAMDLDRCLKVGWLNTCLRRSLRCPPSSQKVSLYTLSNLVIKSSSVECLSSTVALVSQWYGESPAPAGRRPCLQASRTEWRDCLTFRTYAFFWNPLFSVPY